MLHKIGHKSRASLLGVLFSGLLLASLPVKAEMANLYVGIDSREILTRGPYSGLPNPNAGRLTLLYAHVYPFGEFHRNHYHGIGAHSYTGDPEDNPTEIDTSSGNRIPEVYTQLPGVTLVPDFAPQWEGRLISRRTADHYSDFRIRSVHSLSEFGVGSSQYALFHSSGGTRTDPMDGATLALELISISPGLNIADSDGNAILETPGEQVIIGEGSDPSFEFLPVFWVDENTPAGDFSAEFRLVDVNTDPEHTPFPSSGRFFFDFQVPEPMWIEIDRSITLTMPLVTDGYMLEAASSPEGPWTEIDIPPHVDTRFGQSTTVREATFPITSDRQFYRLRRE